MHFQNYCLRFFPFAVSPKLSQFTRKKKRSAETRRALKNISERASEKTFQDDWKKSPDVFRESLEVTVIFAMMIKRAQWHVFKQERKLKEKFVVIRLNDNETMIWNIFWYIYCTTNVDRKRNVDSRPKWTPRFETFNVFNFFLCNRFIAFVFEIDASIRRLWRCLVLARPWNEVLLVFIASQCDQRKKEKKMKIGLTLLLVSPLGRKLIFLFESEIEGYSD